MAVDYDTPRTAQGALPASMATASAGMAASILPTQANLGQLMYQRYYPAVYYVGYMKQAVTAAEANPLVDSANTLLAEAQGLQARSDARRAELVTQQKSLLATRAKLHAARMKAGGKSDIKYLELALDAVQAMEGIDVSMDAARMERLDMGGVGDRMEQVDTYGEINTLSSSARSAIEAIAGVVEGNTATTANSARIADIAATEGGAALQAIKALEDPLAKGSAARALAIRLERSGKMSPDKAAAFAADYMGLSDLPQLATADGATKVRQQLKSTVNEAVVGSGIGEDDLPRQRALAGEVMRAAINRIGAGSGAAAAYSAREKAKELTPEESADLRLYLAAMANDGVITPEGEEVMSAGRQVTLTANDILRGQNAYEKAKKHGTFRAEDAAYFDDEYLLSYKEGIDRSELAEQKRIAAMARSERTHAEVQREAAENFVRTATAVRDLEDYVPLGSDGVNSSFDATVIGGATHIARREGSGVFDLDQQHPDRKRRLGGTGPIAQAPLRQAQNLFLQKGSRNSPMPPADLQQAVQALRNKYKRNPEKLEKAVQYLFAMQVVSTKAAETGRDAPPVEREDDRPPEPPPTAGTPPPKGIEDIPRGGHYRRPDPDRDVIREALPPTGAGASRAAQPAPAGGQSFNMMEEVQQPFNMEASADALFAQRLMEGDVVNSSLDQHGYGPTGAEARRELLPFLVDVPDMEPGIPTATTTSTPMPQFITTNNGNMQTGEVKTDEQLLRSRFASSRPSRAEVMSMGAPSASVGATAGLFVDALGNIVDARTIAAQQAAAEQAARGTRR
jgi:hypothetical protein